MTVRVRQLLIGVGGAVITVVLLALGLWQMRVFEDREAYNAESRAALPPVSLVDHVPMDGTVGDIYGKQVSVSGRYLPAEEVQVMDADGSVRVLSAFELADGRVVAIVRGLGPATEELPAAPPGMLTQTGIFLPTEAAADHFVPAGMYASVRLPLIAQWWPQQLVPGFITLSADQASAQELHPAKAVLPTGEGSLQNLGYALQWWVFAGFAAFMTWRFVYVLGRRGRIGSLAEQEEEV
jgi:cytochrome oxidase assembly protein ShyY1